MNAQSLNVCRRWFKGLTLLVLLAGAGVGSAVAQVNFISTGAVWKYLDDGSDPGPVWMVPGFDDALWNSGPAQLGFGDGDEATTNTAGFVTYYYRRAFNVADASSITNLRARLLRDDGAIVYLNGVEVFRSNMPTGAVNYLTLAAATAADDGTIFFPSSVSPAALVNGNNVAAVEVHQAATTSSDISFDLELTGNPLPLIAIASPTNNQVIRGDVVNITGTAVPAGQSVTLVEAFAGVTKVGESTNASFSILWQSVPPGVYTLRVKVTDSSSLVVTSAPVNITVQAPPATVLIPRRTTGWRYQNLNQDLFTLQPTWNQPGYDDSGWAGPSPGPLGLNTDAPAGDTVATVIEISTTPGGATRIPVVFYRRSFNVSGASAYQGLVVRLQVDDYAVVWLNGQVVVNDFPVAEPFTFNYTGGSATATETDYAEYPVPTTVLREGVNVVAVANYQQAAASSDLQFDLEIEGVVDNVPPTVTSIDPPPGAILLDLTHINVVFSEAVVGVNASDLLINHEAATSVVTNNPNDFTFYFPEPSTGVVQVAWALNQGIADTSPSANPFAGGNWSYTLDTNVSTRANVLISEFEASNDHGIQDEDGNRSDWLELLNLGPLPVVLDGWYLTDNATNLTEWRFPSGMAPLQANNYLLVWASGKNKTNALAPLHTNFRLAKEGGFLALVDPRGAIVSQFTNYFGTNYPPQQSDVSYGRDLGDPNLLGYFATPTPGKPNSTTGSGFTPEPGFSVDTGIYTNASLTVTLTLPTNAPAGATIRYTTDRSVPTAGSLLYSGPITVANNMTIKARVFPPAGTNLFPSVVVAKNYIFLDGTSRDFNSNLPLLIVSTEGQSIAQNVPPGGTRTKGAFAVIDTFQGRSSLRGTPDFQGLAEFELYGQTSIGFPKPPVRIEIQDAYGNDVKVPLLGMPADADWKTRNPYDDKTLLNDFMAFELFGQMGHYSLRHRFVEMFIDTGGGRLSYPADYQGVNVLVETIKQGNDRVDIAELTPYNTTEPTVTGGYIFKKDKDSTGDINFSTTGHNGFPAEALKIHEPHPNALRTTPGVTTSFPGPGYTPSASNQLGYLRSYLNRMETNLYSNDWLTRTGTNHYSAYMDVDAFVDQHWIVEFTKQIDGYRLSDYFSKDRNGKVAPYPIWDWNLSFGNANYLQGGKTNGWYFQVQSEGMTANEHIWLRRLINGSASMGGTNQLGAGGDPDFIQKIVDRWIVLRTNVLNGPRLLGRIEELSSMLQEAQNRDLWGKYSNSIVGVYQWPNPNGPPGWDVDYQNPRLYRGNETNSIIGQMKKWVLGRYIWIDSQFTPMPTFSDPGGEVTNGFAVTIIGPGGATNYFTLDGTDPRLPGGGVSPAAQLSVGPVTVVVSNNVRVVARARGPNAFYGSWSGPAAATWVTAMPPLRITEINYHPYNPPAGNTNDADSFEFIEVKNVGGTPLNVNRFRLGGGIQFDFPNVLLQPGQSAVIVKNLAAFASRYNTNGMIILGTYTGNLANDGDHLTLEGNLREVIHDFDYSDGWYRTTDGTGFTLVAADPNQALGNWNTKNGWSVSAAIGGSPGANDPPPPPRPAVVINEALTHSDTNLTPGLMDTIELYNSTGAEADVSGWFLTDNFDIPRKYVIPADTRIPAGGFVTFTEAEFDNTNSPNVVRAFGLSALGDDVYLFSAQGTNLTGYAHGFDFGAQANGVTFGRYIISTGEDHFVAQKARTLGTTNAGPLVGPLVISEIMYHPPDIAVGGVGYNNTDDEYIELQNISGAPALLYDPAYPTNTWRLRDAVSYVFPATNVVIPAGGFVLVTSFDPRTNAATTAAFRARNLVPDTLPLFGPWSGDLDNAKDSVELARPDLPGTNGVPFILVERVKYSDNAPWPSAADGLGMSLQRIVPGAYGNDPANWVAVSPTPGSAFVPGATPPTILSQPSSQFLVTGRSYVLSVTAAGTPPLRYQWRFNGLPLVGATNSTLSFTPIQSTDAGVYNILVYNGGGAVLGTDFTITTRIGLQITKQPTDAFVTVGITTNFSVVAVGSGTLHYQWRFNGGNLASGTNAVYTVTGQATNEGTYSVLVQDDFDSTVSQVATLALIVRPTLLLQPLSQTVVEGGVASFSAASAGTQPIGHRWRRQGVTITPAVVPNAFVFSTPTSSVLTITNVQLSNAATYSVVASNIAGSSPASSNAVLTVLADTDRDGLPDVWETGHPGFNPNDPTDGARDDDGDGMSNAAEYFAGTDYLDPTSYLRVDLTVANTALVQFTAVSNRTYSVQYTDGLNPILWRKLGDVLARPNTRTEVLVDPDPAANRYYRIVVPSQP